MEESVSSQSTDTLMTFKNLFNQQEEDPLTRNSLHNALTSYFVLHAIIQQIWLVRQAAVPFGSRPDLIGIEIALEGWKREWGSMNTSSISKNSLATDTEALLRVAYLMLCDDFDCTDVRFSLISQCPETISHSIKDYSGTLSLSPRATRAAYCTIQGLRNSTSHSFQEHAFGRLCLEQLFFCESGRLLCCCTSGLIHD